MRADFFPGRSEGRRLFEKVDEEISRAEVCGADPDFLDQREPNSSSLTVSDDISDDMGMELQTDNEIPETADMIRTLGSRASPDCFENLVT